MAVEAEAKRIANAKAAEDAGEAKRVADVIAADDNRLAAAAEVKRRPHQSCG